MEGVRRQDLLWVAIVLAVGAAGGLITSIDKDVTAVVSLTFAVESKAN